MSSTKQSNVETINQSYANLHWKPLPAAYYAHPNFVVYVQWKVVPWQQIPNILICLFSSIDILCTGPVEHGLDMRQEIFR